VGSDLRAWGVSHASRRLRSRDVGPGGSEGPGDAEPDPRAGGGDERRPSLQRLVAHPRSSPEKNMSIGDVRAFDVGDPFRDSLRPEIRAVPA